MNKIKNKNDWGGGGGWLLSFGVGVVAFNF